MGIGTFANLNEALADCGPVGAATPALARFGSDALRAEFLAPAIRGELVSSIAVSEVGAGSDVASIRTKAVKDGDDFVINGQKVWTSGARHADRAILLLRTDLDAPAQRYLPEWTGPGRERVTVRHLLTHTSGMAGNPPEGIKEIIIPEWRAHLSLTEAVLVYSQVPLEFEPGTKFRYSNPGIATLGRIIEVVTGKPYERFLEERILRPLEMTDTFVFLPKDKRPRVAALRLSAQPQFAGVRRALPRGCHAPGG